MLLHRLRVAVLSVIILATGSFFSLALLKILLTVITIVIPSTTTAIFDTGAIGLFAPTYYSSFNLSSPWLAPTKWSDRCDDGSLILLTPKGEAVTHSGPTILDARGNLIWNSNTFHDVTNLKVQHYRGQPYLTFWSGAKTGSQGKGLYQMLDSTYSIAHTIRAVGDGLHADLHEFKITDQGTALFTIYNKTTMSLDDIGRPAPGWIDDSIFQEVDIATNELIFEWKASDHWVASEGHWADGIGGYFGGYKESSTFDFFHINSVDKDRRGNYLISSRHMHSVMSISPNGTTQWVLGGKRNHFKDISRGKALDFRWQHDARWLEEPSDGNDEVGILTLFDNEEGGVMHRDGWHSKGMMLKVDVRHKTVELLHTYIALSRTRAPSQGSMQVLSNGNVFIGWGHSPAITEFTAEGEVVCENHFGPSWFDWYGAAVSYRAMKTEPGEWVGNPTTLPSIAVEDGRVYASWNGATEVQAWTLEGQSDNQDDYDNYRGPQPKADGWSEIDVITKDRFEDFFSLDSYRTKFDRYRIGALDRNGQVIKYSEVANKERIPRWMKVTAKVLVGVGFVVGLVICWQRCLRHREWKWPWRKEAYQYHKLERIESSISS